MTKTDESSLEGFMAALCAERERKTLLDFLRSEIDRQDRESKRPGWTAWALFAAGAALVSYLLAALEPSAPNWANVGVLFVFLSVAIECVRFVSAILRGRHEDNESQRRFEFINTTVTDSRLFAFVLLLRMTLLYVLYQVIHFGLHAWYCRSLVVFLLLNILLAGFALAFSFLRLPFPKSPKTNRWWIDAIVFCSWLGTGIAACIGIVAKIPSLDASIQDWRVATTLVGMSLVIIFLSRLRHSPALLEDLKVVERRLALGQLNLGEAREKADRILHGLTLGDVMEPYVRNALRMLETLESEHKELVAQVAVVRDAIGDHDVNHTAVQITTINTLFRGVKGKAEDVLKAQQKAEETVTQLKKRKALFARLTPHLAEEIRTLMTDVESAMERVNKATTQTKSALRQLVSQTKTGEESASKAIEATP